MMLSLLIARALVANRVVAVRLSRAFLDLVNNHTGLFATAVGFGAILVNEYAAEFDVAKNVALVVQACSSAWAIPLWCNVLRIMAISAFKITRGLMIGEMLVS